MDYILVNFNLTIFVKKVELATKQVIFTMSINQ